MQGKTIIPQPLRLKSRHVPLTLAFCSWITMITLEVVRSAVEVTLSERAIRQPQVVI